MGGFGLSRSEGSGFLIIAGDRLFGSHCRGEARAGTDVDLCLVAEGAERQLDAARRYREALWGIWPCPAFTLLPITPGRLAEKLAGKDPFFATVFREGVAIAS